MSSDTNAPTLPRATRITGKVVPVRDRTFVLYYLSFGPDPSDDALEAVYKALRALKSEDRISAFSFSPRGEVVVRGLDWEPHNEPFRVYRKLHELFRPELPYCGVMVESCTFTEELCELEFAAAGLDQNKYEHFRQGLENLPHVVSAKMCEDTLRFRVVVHGTLASATGRQLLAKSLEACGVMLHIPPMARVEVLGILL